MNTKTLVLYFGCIDSHGHFLWHPKAGSYGWNQTQTIQPWGRNIDSNQYARAVHTEKKDGWTLVGWPDNSIDKRPGSHSEFMVHSDLEPHEVIALAREQWPQIFKRRGFKVPKEFDAPPAPPCNHIIAFGGFADEHWINYADHPRDKIDVDVFFMFCPLCGEKIDAENTFYKS